MKNKKKRLELISEILRSHIVGNQSDLLKLLEGKNCIITQATLSRDLKTLKIAKVPLANGNYKYVLPPQTQKALPSQNQTSRIIDHDTILSLEFSGNLAVIRTKPGYASAIAWDIDNKIDEIILGTIAGDDTILIIPKEGVSREEIYETMNLTFIKNNKKTNSQI